MTSNLITWFFAFVFLVMGVLNIFLVHAVPGIFYLLLAILYLPQFNTFLKKRTGVHIPTALKVIVGVVILWGSLAVGDLAEVLGL